MWACRLGEPHEVQPWLLPMPRAEPHYDGMGGVTVGILSEHTYSSPTHTGEGPVVFLSAEWSAKDFETNNRDVHHARCATHATPLFRFSIRHFALGPPVPRNSILSAGLPALVNSMQGWQIAIRTLSGPPYIFWKRSTQRNVIASVFSPRAFWSRSSARLSGVVRQCHSQRSLGPLVTACR